MFLIHPLIGVRTKKRRGNGDRMAAGLFGPARDRLHDSGVPAGTNLKAAACQLAAQPARLFVIGFAGSRPRTPENRNDRAARGHRGNYFTGRLVSVLGSRARRRLIADRAARVSTCGASSSTIATQIVSTTFAPPFPLVPVLL